MSEIHTPQQLIEAAKKIYRDYASIDGNPTLFLLIKEIDDAGEIVTAPINSPAKIIDPYIELGNRLNDGETYRGFCIISKAFFSEKYPDTPSSDPNVIHANVYHSVVDESGYYAIEDEKNGEFLRCGAFDRKRSVKPSPHPSP